MDFQWITEKVNITCKHIICTDPDLYSYVDKKDLIVYTKNKVHFRYAKNGLLNTVCQSKDIDGFTAVCVCGNEKDILDYKWLIEYRKECIKKHISFYFIYTGKYFYKDKLYRIDVSNRVCQAEKAQLNFTYYPVYDALKKSKFRASFHLKESDQQYIKEKGMDVMTRHAYDFIVQRLKYKLINDGKQTPMKGHPVFIAMHACACCCRGCLYKWHHIDSNMVLEEEQINTIVSILINWIVLELECI